MRFWVNITLTATRLKGIDSDGCHFLTLCSIAEDVLGAPIDLIEAVNIAYNENLIDKKDVFYVKDSCALLSVLTGKQWTRKEIAAKDFKPEEVGEHDYTEAVYFNIETGFHHYRRRGYDTLVHSVTVEKGYIKKYYMYRWV